LSRFLGDYRTFPDANEGNSLTATATAAEVSKNFEAYQDAALREPVIITENGLPERY
jgi:hypothetical protein